MKHLLSNIKSVEVIDAADLRDAVIVQNRGIILQSSPVAQKISQNGLASCEISDKNENNTKVFSIKLQFHCCCRLDVGYHEYCFRITTVTGSQFLMGTADRPYPVITNDETFPSAANGKSGVNVTVTIDSTYPLLAIL